MRKLATAWVPSRCLLCNANHCAYRQPWLCRSCRAHFAETQERLCSRCGLPLLTGSRCSPCPLDRSPLKAHRCRLNYTQESAALIHEFKFRRRRHLAALIADLMFESQQIRTLMDWAQIMTYVPMHPSKLRQRGYNQSLLLAQHLRRLAYRRGSQQLNVRSLLSKTKETPAQLRLDARSRRRNLVASFQSLNRVSPAARILIVDDVFTTGSTLSVCAEALHDNRSQVGVAAITFAARCLE